jgi:hypothetical protein
MPGDRLLFVDTNSWLDFYRSQTGAGLSLLKHLEGVKDKIIMTYQVEIEFNREKIRERRFRDIQWQRHGQYDRTDNSGGQ